MKSRNSKSIFVTGTDTGIGKTAVVSLLTQFLYESRWNVITQKWVQTGTDGTISDLKEHWTWMDKKEYKRYFSSDSFPKKLFQHMQSYTFRLPASPHLASKIDGKIIKEKKIKQDFISLTQSYDCVIVEGAGGALVPFNGKRFLIDIATDLSIPVLVVVGNKLGAINHALLTVEALKARKITILGLVFNDLSNDNDQIILKENIRIIRRLTDVPVLGTLPFSKNKSQLYQSFKPVGAKIVNALKRSRT